MAASGRKCLRLACVVSLAALAAIAGCRQAVPVNAKTPSARIPLARGASYSFQPMLGPVPSTTRFVVGITAQHFPQMVALAWHGGLLPTQESAKGTRVLVGLARGMRFEPVFADLEKNKTDATAPWVSSRVFSLLSAGKPVDGFVEGGISLSGQVSGDRGKSSRLVRDPGVTFYGITIDGKPAKVRAITANEGTLIIADDPADPLVLEYRTLGIGWRLESVKRR